MVLFSVSPASRTHSRAWLMHSLLKANAAAPSLLVWQRASQSEKQVCLNEAS